jgi:4-hydroxy-3-methylbut-2-enyl diphosphate reductase
MSPAGLLVVAPLRFEAHAVRGGLPGAWVERSGMGPRRARRTARRLADCGARAVAVAGVCGALVPELAPGDVVVASELQAPGLRVALESAPALARALLARGVRAHVGPIVGVERLLRGYERERLRQDGAVAVDMESAWLAPLAAGRAFAVLRVVSDGPGHELFSPLGPWYGWQALRALRAAAPALASWFEAVRAPAAG